MILTSSMQKDRLLPLPMYVACVGGIPVDCKNEL